MSAQPAAGAPRGFAIERLHDDQVQIGELFDSLATRHHAASDAQRLADLICTLLRVHDELEATVLQPALLRAVGPHPALARAQQERDDVRVAMDRVELLAPGEPGFAGAVQQLADRVKQRFSRDELELFALVRSAGLDSAALDEALGRQQEHLLSAEHTTH